MIYALHGNLGSVDDWQPGQGFDFGEPLVAIDLWKQVKRSSGLQGSDCEWAPKVFGEEKSLLLGYSLGGRLALHAMLAAPQRWAGAVIVSAHPGLRNERERLAREESDRAWAERALHSDWEIFLGEWNAQPVFGGAPDSDVLPRQRGLKARRVEIAKAFRVWSLGRQQYLGEQLAVCTVPVLWITGACDEKFSQLGAAMAGVMPESEHLAITGCGHRVLDEAPGDLCAAIRDFQKRIL